MSDSIIHFIVSSNFGLGSFLNVLFMLAQLFRLLKTKSAKGVSLITYVGFAYINFSAALYGWQLHSYLMTTAFTLSFFVTVLIVVCIKRFRRLEA